MGIWVRGDTHRSIETWVHGDTHKSLGIWLHGDTNSRIHRDLGPWRRPPPTAPHAVPAFPAAIQQGGGTYARSHAPSVLLGPPIPSHWSSAAPRRSPLAGGPRALARTRKCRGQSGGGDGEGRGEGSSPQPAQSAGNGGLFPEIGENWEYSALNSRVTLGFDEDEGLSLCFREENGLFGGFGEEISLFLFIFILKAVYSWGLVNKIVYSRVF